MARLKFTKKFRNALQEIWDYVAEHSGVESATRLTLDIQERCKQLELFPMSGSAQDKIAPGVRSIRAGKFYLIFFRPNGDEVEVLFVWHTARERGSGELGDAVN